MKPLQFFILVLPCFLFSQIREINKINEDISNEISKIENSDIKRKQKNQKIDSLQNIRFEKYNILIKYFNENPNKQYYLKKVDSTKKTEPFRESYLKLFDKKYLSKPNKSYSANLKFSLTPEGNLTNVTAEGTDQEFNTLSIITLYKLLKDQEPYITNKSKVLKTTQTFNLPIKID